MTNLSLPTADGRIEHYGLSQPRAFPDADGTPLPRIAYAAAHIVRDPLADNDPWLDEAIDWESTLNYRRHLWSLGLGVAEAMDTAQRGMGLSWQNALELIRRSVDCARDFGPNAVIASGAGTDHLASSANVTVDDVIAAYEEQCSAIESAGGRIILMASRALAACATGPDDYVKVYGRILSQLREPVILHWLGEMFDPALAGYWGHDGHVAAMDVCLQVIADNAAKVDGIKISLLSAEKEVDMRRRLPPGVKMYTGDDFNYAELIEGDADGFSHALLGIFDAIAPAASAALVALRRNDSALYHDYFAPTVPLSRHIFKAPTRFYKSGIVFMAYLNGHQDHFTMLGGQESARSAIHFGEIVRLADKAGLLRDPDMAAERAARVMATHGIGV